MYKRQAIGMFNATGLDSIKAIIEAAEELNTPVILAHAEVHNIYNDISLIGPIMLDVAKRAKVKVCVHLDHGTSLEMIKKAIEIGFTSIMIDASSLEFEENIKLTKKVVSMCHPLNISVEGEIGRIKSLDDTSDNEYYYTKASEAEIFVKETGVDALAIAFGTQHGFYKEKPELKINVIKDVKKVVNIPLVMHGGSGLSEEQFKKCIDAGIRKINYYSYMSKAGYDAAKKVIESNKTNYMHDVEYASYKAMKDDLLKTIKIFNNK
ncbi:MAG: class II fructose-bisphosphate aldolase [Firmicutes bacterium]|nr:class II fructose-bisphosphate aldolase [Candidatus Alectryobacillus merdavium]